MPAKRYRWVCPECGKGALGSSRPRKDATVRFCLKCSAKSDVLVARSCPALDARRAAKDSARKRKAARRREREAEAMLWWPNPLFRIFEELKQLPCWRDEVRGTTMKLRDGRRTTRGGFAYPRRREITVNWDRHRANCIQTVLHELAHVADYHRNGAGRPHHDDMFRSVLAEAACELLGVERIDPGDGTASGLDRSITRLIITAVEDGRFGNLNHGETK